MKTTKLLLVLLITVFGFNANANTINNSPLDKNYYETMLILTGYAGATSVGIGQQLEIDAFFIPADQGQALTWSVNNTSGEATLEPGEKHCIVTGVAAGTVTITATTADSSITSSIDITIVDSGSDVWVNAILVQTEGEAASITTPGGSIQMLAAVFPVNATDPSFTWSVENQTGSATISETGQLTAVSDGIVRVIATANDPSKTFGFMDITIDQTAAVFDESIDKLITIFPNPATKVVNITNAGNNSVKLTIVDIAGKVVRQFDLKSNSKSIDVSALKRGMYIVNIQLLNNNHVFQKKLILN